MEVAGTVNANDSLNEINIRVDIRRDIEHPLRPLLEPEYCRLRFKLAALVGFPPPCTIVFLHQTVDVPVSVAFLGVFPIEPLDFLPFEPFEDA